MYPKQMVQTYSVFPTSGAHDVVVGPYNTGLALRRLTDYADNTVVVDNVALNRIAAELSDHATLDHVNQMVATILTATTAPMRFFGATHNRLSDQCAELAPFNHMHFVQPGYTPFVLPFCRKKLLKTSAQDTLSRLLRPSSMMVTAETDVQSAAFDHKMIAGLSILQGQPADLDLAEVMMRMEQKQRFTYPAWSGLTLSTATCVASPYIKREFKVSGVLLANHTNIANVFEGIQRQVKRLRAKKSYYKQFEDFAHAEEELDECEASMQNLRDLYCAASLPDFLTRGANDKENFKPEPSEEGDARSFTSNRS
ncbi:Tubulin gamma-1 chain [Aphelenchoides fujianensis]|nr:Tubulin gamma-1 chain [Aphelenchoides fujianensis]